jgi:glucokinase
MITIEEMWKYLEEKEGRKISAEEMVKILNGCGLLNLRDAIEQTKRQQQKENIHQ